MRFALMLVVCAVVLAAADLKVDHVTAAGSSLKQLQANLSAIGIETVYGGPHSNGATEMALVSFPDGSYLELMAPQAKADAQALERQPWTKFMKADGGPCAWAVRETGVAAGGPRLRGGGGAGSGPGLGWRKCGGCGRRASRFRLRCGMGGNGRTECASIGKPRRWVRSRTARFFRF